MKHKFTLIGLVIATIILGFVLFVDNGIQWQCFSNKIFQDSLDSGKTVAVYFTVEDCHACQQNKEMFAGSSKVIKHIKDNNIVMLYADIAEVEAANALEYLGHDAVPVLSVFNSDRDITELVGEMSEQEVIDIL